MFGLVHKYEKRKDCKGLKYWYIGVYDCLLGIYFPLFSRNNRRYSSINRINRQFGINPNTIFRPQING